MKVLLIDGSNLAYRNYYAQNLQTTGGTNTGMTYGVINSMLTIVRDLDPDVVHVVWDPPGGSAYRKGLYGLYKANREKMPTEFYEEMDTLRQLLNAMGVTQITKPGTESDDVLGFLSVKTYAGHDVYNASNDKDILQLLSSTVRVVHPDKGIVQTDSNGRVAIKEQSKTITLRPDQVPDYKALVGDSSDNYPGLIGFGIGAAISYFELNNSVEAIMNNTADLRNQRSQALNAIMTGRAMIPLFKQLATINLAEGEVEVPSKPVRNESLTLALFEHLEFNQFKALGNVIYRIGGK